MHRGCAPAAAHRQLPLPHSLPQVRRQPYKEPCLIPPHALQQEAAATTGATAPAASITTAALLRCAPAGVGTWAGRMQWPGLAGLRTCIGHQACILLLSLPLQRSPAA